MTQDEHSVSTSAQILLTCKNEGKTPAWIDSVYAHMEIIAKQSDVVGPGNRKGGRIFGVMGPLGAEKKGMRLLELTCLGHRKEDEVLSIYVLIQYRDIFTRIFDLKLGDKGVEDMRRPVFMRELSRGKPSGGGHPVGESQNQPFQLSFNASLRVDFQGSRVTSDGGLILIRELDERLGFGELIAQYRTDFRAKGKLKTEIPVSPQKLKIGLNATFGRRSL